MIHDDKTFKAPGVTRQPACVIVVENLPVPFDRRVWQEACALRDAGWRVSVICPRTERYPLKYEMIEEIAIYRHPLPIEAKGKWGFISEYSAALFHEWRLLFKVYRERGFDVIQACNPPDLIFLAALPFTWLGAAFVFDHHDVCPELFAVKFGHKGWLHRLLLFLERRTLRLADIVISTNETFREIAVERGGKNPSDVVTVYSVPDASRLRRMPAKQSLREGKRIVLGYMGIIGDQDGLDHLVHALDCLVNTLGISDIRMVVVGDGPALPAVRDLARRLYLEEHMVFTGYLSGEELFSTLSAFDIGVIPDPQNEYNDKISMNKVFEYSALGLPLVAYDLTETRRLAGDAGIFAETQTPVGLALAIKTLIDDDALRAEMGRRALGRAQQNFNWAADAARYVAALERAFLMSEAGQEILVAAAAASNAAARNSGPSRQGAAAGALVPAMLRASTSNASPAPGSARRGP